MRRVRLVMAIAAVLLFSYALLFGWHYLLTLPSTDFSVGRRPHAAGDFERGRRAFEVGRTRQQYDLAGAKRVSIDNPFGHITLGPGGPRVEVHQVIYARGPTEAEARRQAQGVHLAVSRRGDLLNFAVDGDVHNHDVGLDLTISLPPDLPTRAATSDGEITVQGLRGPLQLRSASGDVSATGAGGKLFASSASGTIRVEGAREGAEVHTASGNLVLHDITGDAEAASVSGEVTLQLATSRSVSASSTSGNVHISSRTPFTGHLSARAVSGNITITLPPGSDCRVRTTSVSGETRGGLPASAAAPGLVEAKTVSGDIEVGLAAEPPTSEG